MVTAVLSLGASGCYPRWPWGSRRSVLPSKLIRGRWRCWSCCRGQLRACGFAGCSGYARALVKGEVPPDLCPPGGRPWPGSWRRSSG